MTVSVYLMISMGEQAVKQGHIISSKSSRFYFACTLAGILLNPATTQVSNSTSCGVSPSGR
jgi:hypothetical protein